MIAEKAADMIAGHRAPDPECPAGEQP